MSRGRREGFVVRVLRGGAPAGVGIVVGERHILTCAHVVNTVLGREQRTQEQPGPQARVQVEFPILGDADGAPLRSCRVAVWVPPPVAGTAGGDVAGLMLVGEDLPVGAGPARLVEAGDVRDAEVAVFGYPGEPPRQRDGAWAACRLRGAVGAGMIQLDADSEAAFRAQPGYSGSPAVVAGEAGDDVVGMLAAASWDGEARDAYAIPVAQLVDAWPGVLETLPNCPYRGLTPFRAADAEAGLFVGREEETARLRRMVQRHALVVVVGPSGVGKSSLVSAGLLPELGTGEWATAVFRPREMPFFALAKALHELEGSPATVTEVQQLGERLRREGLAGLAGELGILTGKRILIYADQFEELFTTCSDAERTAFLDQILPPADADGAAFRLVCTLRTDFLGQLLDHPGLGLRLQDRLMTISPMDRDALERAVTAPAQACGVTYEEGLAQRIAREAAGGDGGLPLMEFALTQLWPEQRRRQLTFADYFAPSFGGVTGALNRYADGVLAELERECPAERIRKVLLACVRSPGGSVMATRRVVSRDRLAADWDLVEKLAERRLLVTGEEPTSHAPTVELAHEALIRSWERLADWVDADAEFQRWLVTMEERVTEGELLVEARISEAQRWLVERSTDISAELRDLIERSTSARDQRIAELEDARHRAEEAARQAEEARRRAEEAAGQVAEAARQHARFLRQFTKALAVLLVAAVGASLVAFVERRNAFNERDVALSRQVADEANGISGSDPTLAMQLSVAAYHITPTAEARNSLLSSSTLHTATRSLGDTGAIHTFAISPNGQTLAVGSADQAVRLYDIRNRQTTIFLSILTDHTGPVVSVAFSPDGSTLAAGSNDRTVWLWDVADPHHPTPKATLRGPSVSVYAVAFSPDSHTLAAGSADAMVWLWDVTDPRHPTFEANFAGPPDFEAVAFSSDGKTLAAGGAGHTVRLWDLIDHRHPVAEAIVAVPADVVTSVAFSPDAHTLAAGSFDHTVRLWDLRDSRHPVTEAIATGPDGIVNAVALSQDGHTLAAGSDDHTVWLWDVADSHHPISEATLTGLVKVTSVAFSPGGHTLAASSSDATVRLWDVADPRHPVPEATFAGPTSVVFAVVFSPDGRTLATGNANGTVLLWDVSEPHKPTPEATLAGPTQLVNAVAFSRDGRTLAAGSFDQTMRLWNVADPRSPTREATLTDHIDHIDHVNTVAFSPDGHTLASGSYDRTVRLWDVTDPRHPAPLATLTGHTDAVNGVAFSPDGHTLASSSDDHTVRLWDTDPDEAIKNICSQIATPLTPDQWRQYIPDLPYQRPC
ncbi:MAG: AAA family ATPase [Pseudonocardiaceae bacterium]